MAQATTKLSGVEKAAILLLCLGEEVTAQVFEDLTDSEVRMISRCMMNIDHVPARQAKEILDEFQSAKKEYAGLFVQGQEFVRKAISASGDPKRAEMLIEQVSSSAESRPLETIAMMQPRMVANLLAGEHPQTVALVLSTQKAEHTGRILSYLPLETKADVMYRIARIDKVSREVISQIEESLQREIGIVVSKEQHQLGGVEKVVEILGRMEAGVDRNILTRMDEVDAEMADAIRKKMFTFEDLASIDNQSLQKILREVNNDQLTLALKTASENLKSKIFSNISERAAEMIQEDLEAMGPKRLSEVESMQQVIVNIALKLEEEGQLILPGRGGKDVLV